MKKSKNKKKKWEVKNMFQRTFLLFSIIISVVLINNCDNQSNPVDIDNDNIAPGNINFGGGAIRLLFESAAKGAATGFGSAAAGWALGALGLSNSSPDYSEELSKINQSLQAIIAQFSAVQDQLTDINNQLLVLDCSAQQTALTEQTGRIDFLLTLYKGYIATAEGGGKVSNEILSSWVDQVLAEGIYTSQKPMGQILTTIANQLIQPSSGAIIACVKAIPTPEDNTFNDVPYYTKVSQFTSYYYYYQAMGLFLLNEALHYRAWQTAAFEDDDNYSADSVSNVCTNSDALVYCVKAGTFTNTVYNALIDQFTAGGAPYADDKLLMMNNKETPYIWPNSLEDFLTASGNSGKCDFPLTSAKPCGSKIVADFWDRNNNYVKLVVYEGYNGWQFANMDLWATVLSGWTSGTAGNYLQNNFKFKNMKNKIIIGNDYVEISLNRSGAKQYAVRFFDTDFNYSFMPGPVSSSSQFEKLLSLDERNGKLCSFTQTYKNYDWNTASGLPTDRNGFYDAFAHARKCGSNYTTPFAFSELPGWMAFKDYPWSRNTNSNALQYRWPVIKVNFFGCKENRSKKNAGDVWTMCGDDFTYWFDNIVPRPETCDETVGVICKLDLETISNAKQKFQPL